MTTIPLNMTRDEREDGAKTLHTMLRLARPHAEAILTRYAEHLPTCPSQSMRAQRFNDDYFPREWACLSAMPLTETRNARKLALIKDKGSLLRFLALHKAVTMVEWAERNGSFEL